MIGGSHFMRNARTAPLFDLADLGEYPAMLEGGHTSIEGELYEISTQLFPALDEFEGVPDLFRRAIIELEDGSHAFAYLYSAGDLQNTPRIESGSWKLHVRKRPDTERSAALKQKS